jgi:hypothetical protein
MENRTIFDELNDAYAKYYSSAKYLTANEIAMLFKRRVVFKQYTSKKHKWFTIKIYKLCASKEYTYISAYFGKDRKCDCHNYCNSHNYDRTYYKD